MTPQKTKTAKTAAERPIHSSQLISESPRPLEALPPHVATICGLVHGGFCSFHLHTVDLRIGRVENSAREVCGVRRDGGAPHASGPDVVAHDRGSSSCFDRLGRFFIAGGEVNGAG